MTTLYIVMVTGMTIKCEIKKKYFELMSTIVQYFIITIC